MRVGIIGAGFTGLSAAYELLKRGEDVTIFERESEPGGLAIGYKEKKWGWSLEEHYHHWFTNDTSILHLANELGYPVITRRIKTSAYIKGKIYQLDSAKALLSFPLLPFLDKLRMAGTLALLRYNPFWRPLESKKATEILPKLMGEKSWNMIWKPQLYNKMGKYADEISLVWFWTRINKRTASVAYPEGGFLKFASFLAGKIQAMGGRISYNTEIQALRENSKVAISIKTKQKNSVFMFDKVIVTAPSFLFLQMAAQLPESYRRSLRGLKGLGAVNMVLRLKKQFLEDGTYWLSICEENSPILAVVEHTNFMDKKFYNNEHLLYVGNYLERDHKYFTFTETQLLKAYHPILNKLHPNYAGDIIDIKVFKTPFAQPIIPLNYSKIVPPFKTPLPNIFLSNMQQVYPWDRGTNYAVEIGKNVVKELTSS